MKVLYVTHYGILEPLGQSQIIPYLTGLADQGHSIEIISFEKSNLLDQPERVSVQKGVLRSHNIAWHPRRYRGGSSILQLLADLYQTSKEIRRRCADRRIDLIHCRSHVPFFMAALGTAGLKVPLLFDFRGFLAEEYVDSGLWPVGGLRYHVTKKLERIFARRSAAMVVLTEPGRQFLRSAYSLSPEKIFVIPCCVEQSRFRANPTPGPVGPGRSLRVVYSGSTIGRYNMSAIFDFFALLVQHRPGSQLTVLSSSASEKAKGLAQQSRLPKDSVSFQNLHYSQVPDVLTTQDLGLFFLRGDLTLLVASPTKLGEYLASGLVVVAEERLGGIKEILADHGAGCLIDSSRPATWPGVLQKALELCDAPDFRERSQRVAASYFALRTGVDTYAKAYEFAARR